MERKKTILIVDDDPGIIEIISIILIKGGYNVISNTNANLDFSPTNFFPDLILLDNYLENKSGADICKRLKTNELTKHIPVILISGHEGLYSVADEACADDFLSKPFSIQNLLRKIDFLLTDIEAIS